MDDRPLFTKDKAQFSAPSSIPFFENDTVHSYTLLLRPSFQYETNNPAFFDQFGYTKEEQQTLLQQKPFFFILQEDKPVYQFILNALSEAPSKRIVTYRIRCKNGEIRTLTDSLRSEWCEDGNMRAYALSVDITAQLHHEKVLMEERALVSPLYETLPCGILLYRTNDLSLYYANRQALRLMRCPSLSILDRLDKRTCLPSSEWQKAFLAFQAASHGEKQELRLVTRRMDGTRMYARFLMEGIRAGLNEPMVRCMFFDLTEEGENPESAAAALQMPSNTHITFQYFPETKNAVFDENSGLSLTSPIERQNAEEWFLAKKVVAEESEKAWRFLFRCIENGRKEEQAKLLLRINDGSLRWFDMGYILLPAKEGKPATAYFSAIDITNERLLPKGTDDAEATLTGILRQLYPLCLVANLTKNNYYTLEYERFSTKKIPEIGEYDELIEIGASTVPAEERSLFRQTFCRENLLSVFAQGTETVRLQHRQVGDDGITRWIETIVLRVYAPSISDVIQIALAHSIDEQKSNERRLEALLHSTSQELEKQVFYQNLIDRNLPTGIIVDKILCGKLEHIGGRLLQELGYTEEEFLELQRNNIKQLIHKNDYDACLLRASQAREKLAPYYEQEFRAIKKNGEELWLHENGTLVNAQDGTPAYMSIFINIDTLKKKSEALRIREEELRIAMMKIGKVICRFDVPTQTLYLPDDFAKAHGCKPVLNTLSTICQTFPTLNEESQSELNAFFESLLAGDKQGSTELMRQLANGTNRWSKLEFVSVFDSEGKPVRAIISMEDTTAMHEKETENAIMRQSERVLRLIASHSDRIIYLYSIPRHEMRSLDTVKSARYGLPERAEYPSLSMEQLAEKSGVFSESREGFIRLLNAMHRGIPSGSSKLRFHLPTKADCWFEIKYTTLYNEDGEPEKVVLSLLDITIDHERELAYTRYQQIAEAQHAYDTLFVETDLTEDRIENAGGEYIPRTLLKPELAYSEALRYIVLQYLFRKDYEAALSLHSREHLLTMFADGQYTQSSEWQIPFQNQPARWARTTAQLVADPFTSHVRAFLTVQDITDEKEKALETARKADIDELTELYTRTAAETLAVKWLEITHNEDYALLIFDLDDLKMINYLYGHSVGDSALSQFAKILRKYFHDSDILGRVGGDEFTVFLKRAKDMQALSVRLKQIMEEVHQTKLQGKPLQCSIGGVMGKAGTDSYSELYQKADTALYAAKHAGKNRFVFYKSSLLPYVENQLSTTFSAANDSEQSKHEDAALLLDTLSDLLSPAFSINLSKKTVSVLNRNREGFSLIQTHVPADDYLALVSKLMHPDDRETFFHRLHSEVLLAQFRQETTTINFSCRRDKGNGKYYQTHIFAFLYRGNDGDIYAFVFPR